MPEYLDDPIISRNNETTAPAIVGESSSSAGVAAFTSGAQAAAVTGESNHAGPSPGPGVRGTSRGVGVWAESETWMAVYAKTSSTTGGHGVWGEGSSGGGCGVYGLAHAPYAPGIFGQSDDKGNHAGPGVLGKSRGTGVWGESETWMGVYGKTSSTTGGAGVLGVAAEGVGAGVMGKGGLNAGYFEGNVTVTGDLILAGADFAESLPTGPSVPDPGACIVIQETGTVAACTADYDTRVAGIVSGAGGLKPAVVLDPGAGVPVALMGTAYVWVDADRSPVQVGDLLTTSSTPGHAMKVLDPLRALGAIIGKALTPLESGRGLVKVFVTAR